MRIVLKILKWLAALVAVAVLALAAWLYIAPPDLIRVGTNYAAKIVCSNRALAGRDGEAVLRTDVQAPGHWLLGYLTIDVDAPQKTVAARLLGLFGTGLALERAGRGCTSVPDGDIAAARIPDAAPVERMQAADALWPEGERIEPSQDARIAAILDDPAMTGPGLRAVVVVQNGRVVGERYGEGFSPETPLLGWSMSKTVTAAIIGTLVADGRLALDRTNLLDMWSDDGRAAIKLSDLTAMSSGLEFNEDYGDVTDVTRMLYLEPDMAGFAADKPLVAEPGTVFSYSSGTSVIVSRIWQNVFDDPREALDWPRKSLFSPLGMDSAVLEADARGTFVGSSYLYATARDWARFGQFLLREGEWGGEQILPEGYVEWMHEAAPASDGAYGRGNVWLRGPTAGTPEGEDPDAGFDLPGDAYWLLGHDGQTVTVVPSSGLVVVRLGLTPSTVGYKPQRMVEALVGALE